MTTFATPLAKAKVEQLMQPALIRVIDNIRKQLDVSDWQGGYEETLIWPEGTTPEQQQEYAALQKVLHGVPPEEHDRVSGLMSQLPQPKPLYTLRLKKSDQPDCTVDIWALCYQVCAVNLVSASDTEAGVALRCNDQSPPISEAAYEQLEADVSLFDEDGEVDWRLLDDKTKMLVQGLFQRLPK